MRIRLLGTGTPTPSLKRMSSGYLVETGERKILFDFGPGAYHRMLEAGVKPVEITDVFFTHLHYDHVGNLEKFPAADFVVQDDEMAFWTGRYASKGHFRHIVEVEDIVHLVRENFAGRLRFVAGTHEIVPGITVHRVGGHAAGLHSLGGTDELLELGWRLRGLGRALAAAATEH